MACDNRSKRPRVASCPSTPTMESNMEPSSPRDLSILDRSPQDFTELRQANSVFIAALTTSKQLSSPTQRYAKKLTQLLESQIAEMNLLRKEKAKYSELFEAQNKKTKGKSIKLQGKFVFSSEEVMKIVRESEDKPMEGVRPRGRPRKRPIEDGEPKEVRPRGRPRKHPIDEEKSKEIRPRGRPRKHPIDNEKSKEIRPRGRPRKVPTEVNVNAENAEAERTEAEKTNEQQSDAEKTDAEKTDTEKNDAEKIEVEEAECIQQSPEPQSSYARNQSTRTTS